MRLLSFRIENFRNLTLAECDPVPDFMVISGGNGSGKSALLEALMTAKEHAGSYGSFQFDPRAVSADADSSTITMRLAFSEEERAFVLKVFGQTCPAEDEVIIRISKDGGAGALKRSMPVYHLFSYYSASIGSPGFFDYITAHRQASKTTLQTWDASFLSDERAKNSLSMGQQKFQYTKQYLAGLKMRDLQQIQSSLRQGEAANPDSLAPIRELFNRFFAPMSFADVYIDRAPFEFAVSTPRGEIDIDDMSSGEKEILNIFIRFHQLNLAGAVILFDEADAHLHPDLERRYLEELRRMTVGSQLILTTHSPEMMIAAKTDELYTVLKQPVADGNQLVRVTESSQIHDVLADLMGSRGLVSFNQRIVFIEGEDASADRSIYEAFYPPAQHNVAFVPAGNSGTVRKTAEQVNILLSTAVGFQQYFSIVDRDIDRAIDPPVGNRLFRLPVYHVENLLLDENEIYSATQFLLGAKSPFGMVDQVRDALIGEVLGDAHIRSYARALLDAALATSAQAAYDAVYRRKDHVPPSVATFDEMVEAARIRMEIAVRDDTWKADCKGRDVLKSYCGTLGIKYEHFRNLLISRVSVPPDDLASIMARVFGLPKS